MNLHFPKLDERYVEARIGMQNAKGATLLLYKDARVDMLMLDQAVGPLGWRREHTRDNHNCIISIWDDERKHWVSKEDVGVESNQAAEKGLASDSFKRAAFNWGIGRELYDVPFIWVKDNGDKFRKFKVDRLRFDEKTGECQELVISEKGQVVFRHGKTSGRTVEPRSEQSPAHDPADVIDLSLLSAKLSTMTDLNALRELYLKFGAEKNGAACELIKGRADLVKARAGLVEDAAKTEPEASRGVNQGVLDFAINGLTGQDDARDLYKMMRAKGATAEQLAQITAAAKAMG